MKYVVYILQSQNDTKFYVGMTQHFERRLQEHNRGRVQSTKHRIPLVCIYSEEAQDRKSARVREKYWKSGAGREKTLKLKTGVRVL